VVDGVQSCDFSWQLFAPTLGLSFEAAGASQNPAANFDLRPPMFDASRMPRMPKHPPQPSFFSGRMAMKNLYQPRVESLEDRALMSATTTLFQSGLLVIQLGASGDQVQIKESNGILSVNEQQFNQQQVKTLEIFDSQSGHNTINIDNSVTQKAIISALHGYDTIHESGSGQDFLFGVKTDTVTKG
jgi:hypothetical protein